jgi:EPTP domain
MPQGTWQMVIIVKWPEFDISEEEIMTTPDERSKPNSTGGTLLVEHQRLATSGARAVLAFTVDGKLRLAVPQLAVDLPDTPARMNGGDSNIDMLLYRWVAGRFVEDGGLPVPGGEDAVFFRIGSAEFLATACVRTGAGPYDLNCDSVIYRRAADKWEIFQSFPTFAAKQWHFFSFDGRYFLALAQGVVMEGVEARNPRRSCLFEWDGAQFVDFQTLDGQWGYNWDFFEVGGKRLLAYADHVGTSKLLIWNGASFTPFQEFSPTGGRAFHFFRADDQGWLAFANLTGESLLYRWSGDRFESHQSLGGPGTREFALTRTERGLYLVQINFIQGTPAAPKTDLTSRIYRWQDGRLTVVEEFPTSGGTDAAVFAADGRSYLAVANSLSRDVRFREDTVIYRFDG